MHIPFTTVRPMNDAWHFVSLGIKKWRVSREKWTTHTHKGCLGQRTLCVWFIWKKGKKYFPFGNKRFNFFFSKPSAFFAREDLVSKIYATFFSLAIFCGKRHGDKHSSLKLKVKLITKHVGNATLHLSSTNGFANFQYNESKRKKTACNTNVKLRSRIRSM